MASCASCSMPLENIADIGGTVPQGQICIHCADQHGALRSAIEVFEGGVQFFMSIDPSSNRLLAERLTRRNMKLQPCWQDSDASCLLGEQASDAEFAAMFARL